MRPHQKITTAIICSFGGALSARPPFDGGDTSRFRHSRSISRLFGGARRRPSRRRKEVMGRCGRAPAVTGADTWRARPHQRPLSANTTPRNATSDELHYRLGELSFASLFEIVT
ncbi:hypothetical protein EVAR_97416_1 [Eumeta japonica]|uniref:Uncharacterized protein n=1 Tax=Eumeta variegata TaxID=151549 RepID=A0A4C1X116_EUMVA|nr:hypothetical protein EVAR_97416_1 [Eumeta japonica]